MVAVKIDLIILWNDKTWTERECVMSMPDGSEPAEAINAAVKATLASLAGTGEDEKVHSIAYAKYYEKVEKTQDASSH